MYNRYKTELLSSLVGITIHRAIRKWRLKGIPDEEIPDKIDKLQERLEQSSKKEMIAIFKSYGKED
jgi:hypothetical protein